MITIPFEYNKNIYPIKWEDEEQLKYFAFLQHGKFMKNCSVSEFKINEFIEIYINLIPNRIAFYQPLFDQLPSDAKILNIGSGIGTLELILSLIYNWTFYLVDKSSLSILDNKLIKYYGTSDDEHGFYNSWDVLKDGITSTGININRFTMLDTFDDWPTDLDLIMSSYSCGWHYPVSIYWDKIVSSLKPDGRLMLDILNTDKTTEELNKINSKMKKIPVERQYTVSENSRYKSQHILKSGNSHGSNYYW